MHHCNVHRCGLLGCQRCRGSLRSGRQVRCRGFTFSGELEGSYAKASPSSRSSEESSAKTGDVEAPVPDGCRVTHVKRILGGTPTFSYPWAKKVTRGLSEHEASPKYRRLSQSAPTSSHKQSEILGSTAPKSKVLAPVL